MPARAATPASMAGTSDQTSVHWSRRQFWYNRVGFYAAAYERPGAGRVLAFRGTDDLWDGLVDDAAIAAGRTPPQAAAALLVATAAGLGSTGYLTGHSLGGALALIAAAHLGLPAVTFNAPGVMDSCVASAPVRSGSLRRFYETVARCLANPRVRNVRIDGDLVSSTYFTGLQAGARADSLSAPACGLDALCRHSMRTCIEAVRRDSANFEDLRL